MLARGIKLTHQAIFIHMCILIIIKEREAMDGGTRERGLEGRKRRNNVIIF